jgi:hypothetical protein
MCLGAPIDPRAWPWIFDVWVVFVLVAAGAASAKPAWRWLRSKRAEAWPSAQGVIESSDINESKFVNKWNSSVMSTASFTYSYSVAGAPYLGTYRKQFGTDEESEEFLRELEGKPLTIQYNLKRPSDSVVLESSIDTVLRGRAPNPVSPLAIHRYWNPLPAWLKQLLPFFAVLSAIGFVLSLWVHIEAVLFKHAPPSYLFFALHVGIFVVFFPAIVVAQKRVGNTRRRDFWKVVLKGAPQWMKFVLYGLFAYVAVNGILFWFRHIQRSNGLETPDFFEGSDASLTWMGFYWVSFVILYTAVKPDDVGPHCVNGHPVAPGASFCERCGQPVVHT